MLKALRAFAERAVLSLGYGRGPRFMSGLRQRWVVLRHPHGTVTFGRDVYLGPGFSLRMPGHGTFLVKDGVEFRRNCVVEISGEGQIVVGAGSYLTYDVLLACSTTISIGERCGIGRGTAVYDGNHRFRDLSKPFLEQGYTFTPIRIHDDAQVHQLCTILADIGERAVVGANSVVTREIPPFTLAVGAPARVVDAFGPAVGTEPAG